MMQQWRVVGIRLRGGKNLNDGITVNRVAVGGGQCSSIVADWWW